MEIKFIDVGLSPIETDFIEGQKYMQQQIYSAFGIGNWRLEITMPKKKPTTLNRSQTLKYLKYGRSKTLMHEYRWNWKY